MADPKMLLAALAAIAAGLLIIGIISLDWRFFAASALASLVIIAVGIKARVGALSIRFDKAR